VFLCSPVYELCEVKRFVLNRRVGGHQSMSERFGEEVRVSADNHTKIPMSSRPKCSHHTSRGRNV